MDERKMFTTTLDFIFFLWHCGILEKDKNWFPVKIYMRNKIRGTQRLFYWQSVCLSISVFLPDCFIVCLSIVPSICLSWATRLWVQASGSGSGSHWFSLVLTGARTGSLRIAACVWGCCVLNESETVFHHCCLLALLCGVLFEMV